MKLLTSFAFVGMIAFAGVAMAASPAPAPATTPAKPAVAAPAKPMAPAMDMDKDAINKQCIADANAKGLHGKERKKFKYECKKTAKKM